MPRNKKIRIIGSILVFVAFMLQGCVFEESEPTSSNNVSAIGPKAGTLFLYPERIPLKNSGFFNAERGMMFVPLNRSKENSQVIGVEVYRFKASNKAKPDTPPIFFLHGGPSFSGLEKQLSREGTFEKRWQPFLDVSDLIVVSQRGIGPSRPTTRIETTFKPQPLDQRYDDEKEKINYQQVLAQGKLAWETLGVDLSGFTVSEMATDVKDVMNALGYKKLTIWGGSFGSHWGMTIMRNYPEIVERAIMRGMEGPDHTYDHPGHTWNVFKRVAEEAEAAPEFKGFIPKGGLIESVKAVIARADENPFMVTVKTDENESFKVLFDGNRVRELAKGYTGRLPGWPANMIALHNGDFSGAAKKAVRDYKKYSERDFHVASFWTLDCGSGISDKRLAEYEADPALDIIGSTYSYYSTGCPIWDIDSGNEFRRNFETDIPTVIVHGTWDRATPFENALELVPFFKNSKFIPLVRGPHGAIQAALKVNEQFRKGIYKFAATGDMSELPDKIEMPLTKWIVPVQPMDASIELP